MSVASIVSGVSCVGICPPCRLAARGFVSVDQFRAASAVTTCEAGAYQWDTALLGPLCPLMGRKFTAATAEAVFLMLWQVRASDGEAQGGCRQGRFQRQPGPGLIRALADAIVNLTGDTISVQPAHMSQRRSQGYMPLSPCLFCT